MDKTGIIVISICVLLLGVWFVEKQKEEVRLQQQAQLAATNKITAAAEPAVTSTPAPAPAPVEPTEVFNTNTPEKTIVISNANARYTFTSRGGGLQLIELLKYPETVPARWGKQKSNFSNEVASLNTRAPAPVLAVLGGTNLIGDGNFTLTQIADGVRAEKLLPDGLELVKEFHLSSNYLIRASVRLENKSDKSLALPTQEIVVGTATPMESDDRTFSYYGGAMWFDGKKPQDHPITYFSTNTTVLGFFHRTPTTEYIAGAGDVIWAAAHNQFFALLAMPQKPAPEILARPVTLPQFPDIKEVPGLALPRGVQTALVYPAQTLTANSNIERHITLYAGPKEYRTLAAIGEQFQNHADDVMNFGTGISGLWGIGSFFAKILLSAMNWLHDLTRLGYGWIIVLLTILLRLCFWPLTAASTRSMKRMQALAPEIKALKEKYKDEPQKFTQKQMELWKKNKVNPASGCLPMLVQTPVFFGFYAMLRSAIELRGAHFLWVADLTKPDTVFLIPGLTVIPVLSTPEGLPINLLPLLMVGAMVWQAHLQPSSPGVDPGQQKMMRYMPLIFLLFFYNYASGMALYMTVSTAMGILQTRLTKMNQTPPPVATIPALTPPPKKKK